VDEWTYHNQSIVGQVNRTQMLEDHWQNWVTRDHLVKLAAAGVTHLRIPVGYWYWNTTETETFASSPANFTLAKQLLKRLVNEWAAPLNLKVLIDMHTAPGSQNGFDNSGRRGDVDFLDCPQHPNALTDCPVPGESYKRWADILTTVTQWMIDELDNDALFGLEVINEPFGAWGVMYDAITQRVNPDGYARVRAVSDKLQVIFQTGFVPLNQQMDYAAPTYTNVWFDDHNYQCFGADNEKTWTMSMQDNWKTHLNQSCVDNFVRYSNISGPINTFTGEWSLAVTDCTKYLSSGINGGCNMTADPSCVYAGTPIQNGHPEVCEYYNTPYQNMTAEYKQFLLEFARAQMDSFELNSAPDHGWFFWNFHTEDNHAPEWDFLLGVQEGWIDSDVGKRPRYCDVKV